MIISFTSKERIKVVRWCVRVYIRFGLLIFCAQLPIQEMDSLVAIGVGLEVAIDESRCFKEVWGLFRSNRFTLWRIGSWLGIIDNLNADATCFDIVDFVVHMFGLHVVTCYVDDTIGLFHSCN